MIKRLFVLTLFCISYSLYAQNNPLFCEQLTELQSLIKKEHYNSKTINDSLSKSVFNLFIESLDANKEFFTENDLEKFKFDELNIDNYLITNNCEFIDKYISALKYRVETSKDIIRLLRGIKLNYSGEDKLNFKPKAEYTYFKNEESIKSYWNKRIRYSIILKLIDDDSIFNNIEVNFKALEKKAKSKVIQNQLCLLDEILNQTGGIDQFVKESFLNALANYQDPNSMFFNASEKTQFESSVANKQKSFGIITVKKSNGEIIIAEIVQGGVAHKNGGIEVNDIVKSLTSGKDILETICISNKDILAFINDNEHQTITFTIKKKDGTIRHINLTKAITKIEKNTVDGYIIRNKLDFGYINIPSFYTDLESPNGLGLANDVAKELYKLQKEDIKGLILDLRFNGGGSMKEAADLSGMFINRGPLSILKFKNDETITLKDFNRGTLFNKPILVLINSYSASASEFFASIMQDYNRSIIVGSPSHGKSSVQVILPLSETKELGFCKITVEKFYRVTGKSLQSKGVTPDVILPTLYDNFKTNEMFKKHALKNDSINITLRHTPLKTMNLNKIIAKSNIRTKDNTAFSTIKKLNKRLLEDYANKHTTYPLTLKDVYNDISNYNNIWKEITLINKEYSSSITTRNTKFLNEILQYNEEDIQTNSLVLKDLSNDVFIEEATNILLDYINLKSPN